MLIIYRLLTIVIIFMIIGSCSQTVEKTDISITQIAHYNELVGSNPDHYQDKSTLLLIVSQSEEKNKLETFMPTHLKSTIHSFSLDQHIIFAVFQGEVYRSGYDIQITKILYHDPDLYIYTHFETPQRGQLQEGGTRSPVAVVAVERSTFVRNKQLTVHLIDSETKQEVLIKEYTIQ